MCFPALAENKIVSLDEGSDYTMEFTVNSDPSLDTQSGHVLSMLGGSPSENHVYMQGDTIHFRKVRKIDAGTYTVSHSNAAGKGHGSFELKVKCMRTVLCLYIMPIYCYSNIAPPEYVLDTDYVEAEAGSSPVVTFSVTSDPPLNEVIKHTLKKSDGSIVTKRFKVDSNSITFRRVRVEDSGIYTISCCSEEGKEVQATLELEVVCTELLTQHPNHENISTGKGLLHVSSLTEHSHSRTC